MLIAVDFDGVITRQDRFPEIGQMDDRLILALSQARKVGHQVILYTCRREERLGQAVEACRARGLEFDGVNENLESRIAEFGGDTRKISADLYLDDRALGWDRDMAVVAVETAYYVQRLKIRTIQELVAAFDMDARLALPWPVE